MPQANVKATESIEAVKASLVNFSKQATDGMTELEMEVRRVIDWLEHDRPGYWKQRVRKAYDRVGEAKDDLARCLTFHASENHRPSCTEQRMALRKAQEHLAYCQEKQKRVTHWLREIHREMHEYQGRVSGLREVAEGDMPAAIALLDRLLQSIEEYMLGSPSGAAKPASKVDSPDEGTTKTDSDE